MVTPAEVIAAPARVGERVFVGRERELQRCDAVGRRDGPVVVFVHGVAGAGKSALLRQLRDRHGVDGHGGDRPVTLALDARSIEPTESGFLAALASTLGVPDDAAAPVPERLAGWLDGRVVILVDQYEVLRLLDTWLRQVLLPALPPDVGFVLAGREPPHPAWVRLPAGTVETVHLGPLTDEDGDRLLRALGVDPQRSATITRFAGGHPLTLTLAALAAREGRSRHVEVATMDRLLDAFAAAYLDHLDEETHRVLEAAAVVRRVTRPILAAVLPDVDVADAHRRLQALPFVDRSADGLALHESVQRAIVTQLRAADPARLRELRQRVWRHLRGELRHTPKAELWRHTADMIYLLENSNIREAHFPSGAHRYAIEPATAADADAVDELIGRHEPPTAASLLRAWWQRAPDAFKVARDGDGSVAGLSIMTTSRRHDPRRFSFDPVVRSWLRHLESEPIPASQDLLLFRRWLTREAGDGPCAAQAACWLDLKRTYAELRPRLRRIYATTTRPEVYLPVLAPLDGAAVPDGVVELDGRAYQGLFLDFGPSSVDGWLSRVAANELGLPEDELVDVRSRQLIVRGERIDLTRLEFEVLHYLRERAGTTVSRYALLEDIWGNGSVTGSNVLEVVIRGLRRKLGVDASLIRTVRGVGYRLEHTAS